MELIRFIKICSQSDLGEFEAHLLEEKGNPKFTEPEFSDMYGQMEALIEQIFHITASIDEDNNIST